MSADSTQRAAVVQLDYEPPYDWPAMLDFFAARAIPGVEVVDGQRYARTIGLDGGHGTVTVSPIPGRDALAVSIAVANDQAIPEVVHRLRRVFDLDANLPAIQAHLRVSPVLAPLLQARPGLRVPGAWDGFELGVRAMLGQQITVVGARQLAGKLAAAFGAPLRIPAEPPGLATVFPGPEALAEADVAPLGMPGVRARSISAFAATILAQPDLLERRGDLAESIERLCALPGIGEWTAQYIALRALREPDAFPASDIGLLRAATPPGEERLTPRQLLDRAEAWRPWRAYAAQHLWTSLSRPVEASASLG